MRIQKCILLVALVALSGCTEEYDAPLTPGWRIVWCSMQSGPWSYCLMREIQSTGAGELLSCGITGYGVDRDVVYGITESDWFILRNDVLSEHENEAEWRNVLSGYGILSPTFKQPPTRWQALWMSGGSRPVVVSTVAVISIVCIVFLLRRVRMFTLPRMVGRM